MGIPLAFALLTILFHHHNKKYTNMQYILSAKANYVKRDTATNQDVHFGIVNKTGLPSQDSWIFAKKSDLTKIVSERQLTNVIVDIDVEDIRVQDIVKTLQSALHLHQLSISLRRLSNNSPLLNQRMLPFMCAVSCLFLLKNLNRKNTSNVCVKLLNPGGLRCFLLKEMETAAFQQLPSH